jgi:cytoskeletal protein CcmA (bactofilin family)
MLKGFKSKLFGKPSPDMPEHPLPPETPQPPAVSPFRRLEDRASAEDAVIPANGTFKGEIVVRAGARIGGEMLGNVRCEGLLWIQETGRVKGNISSPYVILEGELEGDVGPSVQVELRSKANMRGNIQTQLLAVADGSFFDGQVNMPTPEAETVRFAEKRQPGSNQR